MNVKKIYETMIVNSLSIIRILLILLFSSIVLLNNPIKADDPLLMEKWFYQFYLLLGIFIVIALLSIFVKKKGWLIFGVILRFILLLIMGYPLGNNLIAETILFLNIITDVVLMLREPYSIISFLVTLTIIISIQNPAYIWYEERIGPDLIEIFTTVIVSVGFYLLIIFIKSIYIQMGKRTNHAKMLESTVDKLVEANIGFQEYSKILEKQSQDEERKRITRELHDSICYTLTNIVMMAEAAKDLACVDNDDLINLLNRLRNQGKEGLDDTRLALRLVRAQLRSSRKGMQVVYKLVENFKYATGTTVKLYLQNAKNTYGDEVDSMIYHIIQEGMTNAFRHGKATHIQIQFWEENDSLKINIRDNGIGSAIINKGIGLTGLSEIIKKKNGTIKAKSVFDGFQLSVKIPLAF